MRIRFSSEAPAEAKQVVRELLYHNPAQHKVRHGIVTTLQKHGDLQVTEHGNGLQVAVTRRECQTLFAFDDDSNPRLPVGILVFTRMSHEEMNILHIAVQDDYALQPGGDMGLALRLVETLQGICRRVNGVKTITFSYRQQISLKCHS